MERHVVIVAGFGFRSTAGAHSLRDAFDLATKDREVSAIATLRDKAETPAFLVLARTLGLRVLVVEADGLVEISTDANSSHSRAARGTGSVAEATALAAAGPEARLVQTRVISGDRQATCALAQGGVA